MPRPAPHPRFELQGHRGARGLFPENTIEGFRAAARLGVDALELDVGLTRDGVAVVFHDATLSPDIVRDAAGTWLVRADIALNGLTHAELSAHDVGRLRPGSVTASQHPGQTPCDGAGIPDFADVVRLAVETGVRLAVELKTRPDRPGLTAAPEAMADATLAVVDLLGAAGLVDIRAFDWRCLVHLAATRPELPLTWLSGPYTQAHRAIWWAGAAQADPIAAILEQRREAPGTWAPEHVGLSRDDLARAHGAGMRVVPWTVNDPGDMARLIGWGTDGICTDRPDIAREVMRANGLPLPRAAD